MPPKQRKIAIMGFRSVGKSSLTIQFVEGQFVDSYDPTVENTFLKDIKIKNQVYSLKLVDTAGQDEYSVFPQVYAMDIHGYCFVYSINNPKSFEVIRIIYEKLTDVIGNVITPIILVGNKKDLSRERAVSFEQGKELADLMRAKFVEVSAKDNASVNDLFTSLIMSIERKNQGDLSTDSTASSKDKSSCSLS